ncbi:MAG: cation transporting ATPase C-terminal domain-containing protein [Parvularculaceae bacterium]
MFSDSHFGEHALGGPLILLPVQILWMNLVTDGLSALALGVERAERDVMTRPPRPPQERLLDRRGVASIALLGGYIGLAAAWLFQTYLAAGDPDAAMRAQTVAFTAIIVMEKFNVFNFRTLYEPLWRTGFFTNRWLLIAVAGTLAVQTLAVYAPPLQALLHTVALRLGDWGTIVLIAAPVIMVVEAVKTFAWARHIKAANKCCD